MNGPFYLTQPEPGDKRPRNAFGILLGFGEAYSEYYRKQDAMRFNDFTDRWYGELCDYSGDTSAVVAIVRRAATKRNLELLHRASHSLPLSIRQSLREQIAAILRRRFRNEFRFTYSRSRRDCSATSSLFNSIRQAVEYHQ